MTVVEFPAPRQQTLQAKYICSACGADRSCNCNAPAIEKLAQKQEQDRQRAKEYRARKAEENQQRRHVTESNKTKVAAGNDVDPDESSEAEKQKHAAAAARANEDEDEDDTGNAASVASTTILGVLSTVAFWVEGVSDTAVTAAIAAQLDAPYKDKQAAIATLTRLARIIAPLVTTSPDTPTDPGPTTPGGDRCPCPLCRGTGAGLHRLGRGADGADRPFSRYP
jgi:hypothetical protein